MQAADADGDEGPRRGSPSDGEGAAAEGEAPANGSHETAGPADHGASELRLMSGSGQSKSDRQDLRRRQRELRGVIADLPDDAVGKCRWKNNMLFGEVRYPKEAALDASNLGVIAEKSGAQADRLVSTPRYDAVRLAAALAKKGSVGAGHSRIFDWHALGVQVGVCFNALPSNVSFLHGPLEVGHTPKERKKRAKREWKEFEEGEEETPEDVEHKKPVVQDNELSAVGRNIRKVREALHQKSREQRESILEHQDEYIANISREGEFDETALLKKKRKLAKEASRVDAIDILFDQHSFTRTVENMFNFSFDVFHGLSGIKRRKLEETEAYRHAGIEGLGPGPVVYPAKGRPHGNRQAILSLNMEQWRRMCRVFHEGEIDEPLEIGGTHAAINADAAKKCRADSHAELKSPPELMASGNDNGASAKKRRADGLAELTPPVVSQTDSEAVGAEAMPGIFAHSRATTAAVTPEKERRQSSHSRKDDNLIQICSLQGIPGEEQQSLSATSSKRRKRDDGELPHDSAKAGRESPAEQPTKAKRKTPHPNHQRTLDAWVKSEPGSEKSKAGRDANDNGTGPVCIDLCDEEPQEQQQEVVCIDLCDDE